MTHAIAITGEFAADASVEAAAPKFARLFKLDVEKATAILSAGKPRQLVSNLDEAKAQQIVERLESMGLIVEVTPPFAPPEPEPLELSLADEPGFSAGDTPPPQPKAAQPSTEVPVEPDDNIPDEPYIERVPAMHGFHWLSVAFEMLKAQGVAWIVAMIGFGLLTAGVSALPYGEYISVFLWPLLFAGLMVGAHQQRETGTLSPFCFLSGLGTNPVALVVLGVASALIVVVTSFALVFVVALVGGSPLIASILVFLLLMPLIVINMFAPTLIAVRGMGVVDAITWSLKGGLPNLFPVMVHIISSGIVMMLGALLFGVGLLIAGPIVLCSFYLAYADIYD